MRVSVRGLALAGVVGLLSTAGVSAAQEAQNYEQLRKQHDDALRELRAAQERKNQLSAENEDLRKQLAAGKAELEELRRTDADSAERGYYLRAHYMAWKAYANRRPEVLSAWRAYLQNDVLLAPADPTDVIDPDWPISAWRPAPRERVTTAPTTAPVTQPATAPATEPATTNPATTSPSTTLPIPTAPLTAPTTRPATVPS